MKQGQRNGEVGMIQLLQELQGERTLRDFADDVGIQFTTLHRWLRGVYPVSVRGLGRLAKRYPTRKVRAAIWEYLLGEGEKA